VPQYSRLAARTRFASCLYRLVEAGANSDALVKINLKQLQRTEQPQPDQDKREFYMQLQELAKTGPLFSEAVIRLIDQIGQRLNKAQARDFATLLMQQEDVVAQVGQQKLREVADWIAANSPSLAGASVQDLVQASDTWHRQITRQPQPQVDQNGRYGPFKSRDVVYDFGNGWVFVNVPSQDLGVEGRIMDHCVGGYCEDVDRGRSTILSLRDPKNMPHATIELNKKNGQVTVGQIRGKKNANPVSPKYRPYVEEFVKAKKLYDGDGLTYAPTEVWRSSLTDLLSSAGLKEEILTALTDATLEQRGGNHPQNALHATLRSIKGDLLQEVLSDLDTKEIPVLSPIEGIVRNPYLPYDFVLQNLKRVDLSKNVQLTGEELESLIPLFFTRVVTNEEGNKEVKHGRPEAARTLLSNPRLSQDAVIRAIEMAEKTPGSEEGIVDGVLRRGSDAVRVLVTRNLPARYFYLHGWHPLLKDDAVREQVFGVLEELIATEDPPPKDVVRRIGSLLTSFLTVNVPLGEPLDFALYLADDFLDMAKAAGLPSTRVGIGLSSLHRELEGEIQDLTADLDEDDYDEDELSTGDQEELKLLRSTLVEVEELMEKDESLF